METKYNSIQEPIDIVINHIKRKQAIKDHKFVKNGVEIIVEEQPLSKFEKASLACALLLEDKMKESERMNIRPKFYTLEDMTQEDLNKLAFERNKYVNIINELEKELTEQVEYGGINHHLWFKGYYDASKYYLNRLKEHLNH